MHVTLSHSFAHVPLKKWEWSENFVGRPVPDVPACAGAKCAERVAIRPCVSRAAIPNQPQRCHRAVLSLALRMAAYDTSPCAQVSVNKATCTVLRVREDRDVLARSNTVRSSLMDSKVINCHSWNNALPLSLFLPPWRSVRVTLTETR
jgi:hypothetical protein